MTRTLVWAVALAAGLAAAVPSRVEPVVDGVWTVHDDNGNWGGMTNGITHQNAAPYLAKKTLDLSDVPEAVWNQVREVRLSVFFMVRDFSWHDLPKANGLDEAYEFIVNGTPHRFPTSNGAPVFNERGNPTIAWYDVVIPKAELKRGVNEIVVHKAEGEKTDDYLYLGIDNSVQRGNSAVAFDGKAWTQDKLTIPGGNGEYMVRLYLITRDTKLHLGWQPGNGKALDDEANVVTYAGAHGAQPAPGGARLAAGQTARLEWRPGALDALAPATATVNADGPVQVAWLDAKGAPGKPVTGRGEVKAELPAGGSGDSSGLVITAQGPAVVQAVSVDAGLGYHPVPKAIDLAPVIAPTPPLSPPRKPTCEVKGKTAVLTSGNVVARFELGDRLRLVSLRNDVTQTEMVRVPDQVMLFLVGVGDKLYGGSRDFKLTGVKPAGRGFVAQLALPDPALTAELTANVDDEGLRLGLKLANAGAAPVDFKLAFPHLAGLAVSDDPAADYYYFPMGGGIIADTPAILRKGYGDHQALWQLLDLYAPAKGGGLMLRVDDAEGWHKLISLRKHLDGTVERDETTLQTPVRPEYKWEKAPLDAVPGTGLAIEYLRRTRPPGGSFAPAPAVLAAHPGDWHVALRHYADWAHKVWKFRPYPGRLETIRNMIAAGWGQSFLFKDGAYRTDIIRPRTDCVELMSWWDWSDKGPFNTPFDQLDKVLTPAQIKMWEGYFVTDPVTGKRMWNNQPGDYKGYNERFGGLPAFRKAIETYRQMGSLVTLYTDPFRLDENCETGRLHGKEWGVVGVDGTKTTAYEVWNPCHDLAEVRQWVAETMGRVMRETGADGIRLDEYGHRGYACYDPTHHHTFAEQGITQWMKATAETVKLVHAAMDQVKPGLVLTTEHPGYDYLMQYLDGCITYDLTVQRSPMRPVEVNNQRFYFPECKAYELDHQGADVKDRKKFWNAVESFGRYYPGPYYTTLSENEDVYQGRDSYPLLVTPGAAQYVYVNRFRGAGKTIYHLDNATGHTFEGTALTVEPAAGDHVIDLINLEELTPNKRADGRGSDLRIYIPRDDVTAVAVLPRRLTVQRAANTLTVTAQLPPGPCRLAVVNANGDILAEQPAQATMTVDLAAQPQAAAVKLLSGRRMVDVAVVPKG